MSTRQKILLPLMALACVVLWWQVMVVFFPEQWSHWHPKEGRSEVAAPVSALHGATDAVAVADGLAETALVEPIAPTQAQATKDAVVAGDGALTTAVAAAHQAAASLPSATPAVMSTASASAVVASKDVDASLAAITPTQQRYMQLANAYQLAKLEHRLAEEEAAIAQAKLSLQAVEKQIHGGSMGAWPTQDNLRPPASVYQLVYLDGQEGAEWVATLAYRGHYIAVHPDDVLANGDKVLRIDHQGVWLDHGGQQRCLRFMS